MATDLVCGMTVDHKNPPAHVEHEGREYLFCSVECKESFEKDPERYIEATRPNDDQKSSC